MDLAEGDGAGAVAVGLLHASGDGLAGRRGRQLLPGGLAGGAFACRLFGSCHDLLLLLCVNVLLAGSLTLSLSCKQWADFRKKMNLPAVTTAGKSRRLVTGESVRNYAEHSRNSKKSLKCKQNDARRNLLKGQIL